MLVLLGTPVLMLVIFIIALFRQFRASPRVHLFQIISWLLIIGGVGSLIYFVAVFNTSVRVPEIGRVENIGLISDRQIGVIVSSVVLVIGVVLAIFRMLIEHRDKSKSTEDEPINYWPTNEENSNRRLVSEKRLREILQNKQSKKFD